MPEATSASRQRSRISRRRAGQGKPCAAEALEPRRLLAATPVVVDLLVAYTPQARGDAGGTGAIDERVRRAVADTNFVLANSQVDVAVRLVHAAEIEYVESGRLETDLARLRAENDGYLDDAHTLRDRFGADLVTLLVADGNDGGRAYQPDDASSPMPGYGFGIVQQRYAADDYIFAHEIAHNLGAGHTLGADAEEHRIPFAHDLNLQAGPQRVGTILADGPHIPFVSNPDLAWRGVSIGSAEADNARAIRNLAPAVASYRPTVVPDLEAPAAMLGAVTIDGARRTLRIDVAYADDTAVSIASLDDSDVSVAGPGGVDAAARFVAVDRPTDGAQRRATYELALPDVAAALDPAAYQFSLLPGQVNDAAGHAAPGGGLGGEAVVDRSDFPDIAGPRTPTALDLGDVIDARIRASDVLGTDDPGDFYRVTLSAPADLEARLSGLSDDANLLLVKDLNGDGAWQSAETLAHPAKAGTDDEQIVAALDAGTYYVWVSPARPGIATDYVLDLQAAPSTAVTGVAFQDGNGDGSRGKDDGPAVGRRIYADENDNGAFDAGEPTAFTDAAGRYLLRGLAAGGSVVVRQALPSGWRQTTPAGTAGAQQGFVRLAASARDNAGPVLGSVRGGTIAGSIYDDANGNGSRNAAEPGLAGWRVFLDADRDGVLGPAEHSTSTDAAGAYRLTALAPGAYTVRQLSPAGWRRTTSRSNYAVTISGGQTSGGRDFGNTTRAMLAGTVFADVNGNKIRDAREGGLSGWRVYLDADRDGTKDGDERSTRTGKGGTWSFKNLTPGDYSVRLVPSVGHVATVAPAATVELLRAQSLYNLLFGQRRIG